MVQERSQLLWSPGDNFEYSSTNYLLLGLIIENMTQKSYSVVLNEKILSILGMVNTFLFSEASASDLEDVAHSYKYFNTIGEILDIFEFSHSGWAWTAGGLISTAEELNTFMRALASGQLFENNSTFTLMTNKGLNDYYELVSEDSEL